jgi:hypothetical protein
LFLSPDPSGEIITAVFGLLREQWKNLYHGPLLIAPALEQSDRNAEILERLGFRKRNTSYWGSSILSLEKDEHLLRSGLASTWRNRLRSSERSGLVLDASSEISEVDWILKKHLENMHDKQFAGLSAAFLKALYEFDRPDFVVFRACLAAEPVAGIIVVRFGECAEYLMAPRCLKWKAVNRACQR